MSKDSLMYFIAGAIVASTIWFIAYVYVFEPALNRSNKKILILKRILKERE